MIYIRLFIFNIFLFFFTTSIATSNDLNGINLFVKPGFYSIDSFGWDHTTLGTIDEFLCKDCGSKIRVIIGYGREFTDDIKYTTNREFLDKLDTEDKQKELAKQIISEEVPKNPDSLITVERVGFSKIGGLDVFEFSAIVESGSFVLRYNSMVAIHKHRIVVISLSYLDGDMNDVVRASLNRLYSSLVFFS